MKKQARRCARKGCVKHALSQSIMFCEEHWANACADYLYWEDKSTIGEKTRVPRAQSATWDERRWPQGGR